PGEVRRPRSGADDQYHPGPARGEQPAPRRRRRGPPAEPVPPGGEFLSGGLRRAWHRQDGQDGVASAAALRGVPRLQHHRVSYPWHVQPFTTTGAPPPFPGTCPSLILAAYSSSTLMA